MVLLAARIETLIHYLLLGLSLCAAMLLQTLSSCVSATGWHGLCVHEHPKQWMIGGALCTGYCCPSKLWAGRSAVRSHFAKQYISYTIFIFEDFGDAVRVIAA